MFHLLLLLNSFIKLKEKCKNKEFKKLISRLIRTKKVYWEYKFSDIKYDDEVVVKIDSRIFSK